jgi:hypothetical protein
MSMISILKPLLLHKCGKGIEFQLDDRITAICSQVTIEDWNSLKEFRLEKSYITPLSQEDDCILYKINEDNESPFWTNIYLETPNKIWYISIVTKTLKL